VTAPPRGAYTRVGADEPDAAIFAAATALIRSIPAQPSMADMMAAPQIGRGVDWDALGSDVPEWVDEVSPSLVALRCLEPPPPRPWRATARPVQLQLAESTTAYIMFLAGRGTGKTWAASNAFAEWALSEVGNWAVVAPTFSDARQICVEGPSGLLVALGDDLVSYDKSKYEIRLRNGSLIYLASDDAPARLRGKNLNGVWADELGSWRNLKETWEEGIEFATRIGSSRRLITTTPKRGNKIIKELHDRGKRGDPNVTLLRGSTMDNAANLSATFMETVRQRYSGTTLGRQELDGELLDEVEGALVTVALIDATRVMDADHVPLLRRIVVGVDPAVTAGETSDACGIVVVGLGGPPMNGWVGRPSIVEGLHLYFLADHTMRGTPRSWSLKALQVAEDWDADAMIVETNQGGDLCTTMLRMVAKEMETRTPRVVKVHASVGKRTRAEPVAGVFEQCRAHIVGGIPGIEDGFTSWVPGDPESPNELDAAVWGAIGLMPALAMKGPSPVRVIA
jgi:phage terminase large subunit-like protein